MTLNNPKIFLTAFAVSCLTLLLMLYLQPEASIKRFTATVTSQTLTQSLDGHRRYLNVVTEDGEPLLIQSDPKLDCPKQSQVLIEQENNSFTKVNSYQVIKCYQHQ
ncbi:hypothetical protein [Vibrio atypicus]|uniref:hypothetical protein n=1 Tax=Vibrio atypicus TaxID=558271 RepID=UPI001CECFD5E|nr:hypothetical protein [Vibrio atypicus]